MIGSNGENRAGNEIMQVDMLSKHFVRRWIKRRGVVPSLESVNLILRKGQVTKRGQDLYKVRDGRLLLYRTMTEVWVHSEALIIWIDEGRRKAVTLIVPVTHLDAHGVAKGDSRLSHWMIDFIQGRPKRKGR